MSVAYDYKRGPSPRRLVNVAKPAKKLRLALAQDFDTVGRAMVRTLARDGVLSRLHADAQRRLAKRAKQGPVGRSGGPLGPTRTDALQEVFDFDSFRLVSNLTEDAQEAFRLELEGTLIDAYPELFEAGGQAARRALGVRGSFNLRSPAVADALLERANQLSGNIAEDVFDRLKTVIAEEFYFQGRGPFEVAKSLAEEFDWLSQSRAELIARTETGAVVEEGQWLTYYVTGVPFKRWLTTLDGRERPDHFKAHGQLRPIDEPFELGDGADVEYLMHPLDPAGSASQVCNCRCTEIPVVSDEQAMSDADVWNGDNDPDEFARDRRRDPDLPPGLRPPPPSAVDDLDFQLPEDEKRYAEVVEIRDPTRVVARHDTLGAWFTRHFGKAEREYTRDEAGRFSETAGGGGGGGRAAAPPAPSQAEGRVMQARQALKDAATAKEFDRIHELSKDRPGLENGLPALDALQQSVAAGDVDAIEANLDKTYAAMGGSFLPETQQALDKLARPYMDARAAQAERYQGEKATHGRFDSNDAAVSTAQQYEAQIRDRTRERGLIIGADGQVLADSVQPAFAGDPTTPARGASDAGGYGQVPIPDPERERTGRSSFGGGTLVHNHPNSLTLSGPDVEFAAAHNLREIRAVGYNGNTFRLQPKPEKDWSGVARARSTYANTVRIDFAQRVKRGEMTPEEAGIRHFHETWLNMAKDGWINYEYDPKPAHTQR